MEPTSISGMETGHYLIKLEQVLTDSMHGEMHGFEIVTVRLSSADGAEGVGYTFTCGRNGGAIADILRREITGLVTGEDPDRIGHQPGA